MHYITYRRIMHLRSSPETWKVSKTFQIFIPYPLSILIFQGAGLRKKTLRPGARFRERKV